MIRHKAKYFPEPSNRTNRIVTSILDSAFEVHKELGPGYLEKIYQEALTIAMSSKGLVFEREKPVNVKFQNKIVGKYILDFFVENTVIIEIKSAERLLNIHKAQTISYLKATNLNFALLINFNEAFLKNGVNRVILSQHNLP